MTIALAESCTGGMIAAALTDVVGASAVVLGSAVTYSNESKVALLDVPAGLLAQFGAVSEECVIAMAEGAQRAFSADICVSVSGIAGPGGGAVDKPVGTVWFAVRGPAGTTAVMRRFPGASREAVRARATAFGLDLLRRQVFGLAVTPG
jgi:PncC family amidohydrolase